MLKLWCAGKLGNCPNILHRFRSSCLWCRWRRKFYGKWINPAYWIKYTYKSIPPSTVLVDSLILDGLQYYSSNGAKLSVTRMKHVWIDPRGKFTYLRCAAIKVLDELMLRFQVGKPLIEMCEFLANYP